MFTCSTLNTQGSVILSEMIILAVAVSLLTMEFSQSKREKEEEEEVKKKDRELLRTKLYNLEVAIARQNKQIQGLAKSLLRRAETLGKENTSIDSLKKITSATSASLVSKDAIKPLELGKSILYSVLPTCNLNWCIAEESKERDKGRHAQPRKTEEEDKSLTDEFVEFIEEVTEEILEVIIPEDD